MESITLIISKETKHSFSNPVDLKIVLGGEEKIHILALMNRCYKLLVHAGFDSSEVVLGNSLGSKTMSQDQSIVRIVLAFLCEVIKSNESVSDIEICRTPVDK